MSNLSLNFSPFLVVSLVLDGELSLHTGTCLFVFFSPEVPVLIFLPSSFSSAGSLLHLAGTKEEETKKKDRICIMEVRAEDTVDCWMKETPGQYESKK